MAKSFGHLFTLCIVLLHCYVLVTESSECAEDICDCCDCGYVPYGADKKLNYVVNCTNTGFDNTMMLRKLPSQTEVLVYVGNEVKDLPLNIFGQDVVYSKLHTIDLSNNHIQTIKGKTFHNVANVTKLILNDNDLYIVSKDHHPRMFSNFVHLLELHMRNAFTEKLQAGDYLNNLAQIFENSSLNHLKVLNMEKNEISGIHHGEFCSLPALEELYLGYNHLKDVSLNFTCLKYLKILDIGSNSIPYFSDTSLKYFENIERDQHLMINLTSNPFRCDCHMVNTYNWISRTPLTLVNRKNFNCSDGFPPIKGKALSSIQLDELKCIPQLKSSSFHYSPLMILFIGLFFVVSAVGVLVYKNFNNVTASWRRIYSPIRTKFHYVSLDRRATVEI